MHALGLPGCPRAGSAGERKEGRGLLGSGPASGEHVAANLPRWSGCPFPAAGEHTEAGDLLL